MKRDLELIRKILIAVEKADGYVAFDGTPDIAEAIGEADLSNVGYQVSLLSDCNYLEVSKMALLGLDYYNYTIFRLTSAGCDYLDSVRDPGIWAKTKTKLESVGGSVSLDVVKDVACKLVAIQLGI
ncbi:MAG: DUF2513 domain-containing protein [Acidaminococcaceae bacterium]|jgi:hypothetical protein|nr:DUF2513 domain-containing protein [Acidaminococcaceae bacterium]